MTSTQEQEAPPASRSRSSWAVAAVLVGAGAALVGLLPWLLTGMRLPLQNLWASPTLPEDMPVALLPFNQYMVLSLIGMLVVPGVIAGLAARWWPWPNPRRTATLATAGLAAVQVVATVQTLLTVVPGLRAGTASQIYVAAITAAVVVSLGVCVAVCGMLARGSVPTVVLAACVGSIAVGHWLTAFFAVGNTPTFLALLIHHGGQYAPAVLTGLALAWCGWKPARRLLVWIAALLLLWVGTAVLDTILAVVSYRADLGNIQAMTDIARFSLTLGLTTAWVDAAVAAAIGMAGVATRLTGARLRRNS
ncbi:hypothetical protein [Promicromonospora sp. NPDC023805]|uniref:hypothetical protein n=1 Tax=Promicromonospora sp. NPDC023805 TaxID=3154696 RepID=UPI0033FD81E8